MRPSRGLGPPSTPTFADRNDTTLILHLNPSASSELQEARDKPSLDQPHGLLARVGVHVFALLHLPVGGLSLSCLFSYINDTDSNTSRYQYLQGPLLLWAMMIPVLLAAAFIYHRAYRRLRTWERVFFGICVALPTISVLLVFVVPMIVS